MASQIGRHKTKLGVIMVKNALWGLGVLAAVGATVVANLPSEIERRGLAMVDSVRDMDTYSMEKNVHPSDISDDGLRLTYVADAAYIDFRLKEEGGWFVGPYSARSEVDNTDKDNSCHATVDIIATDTASGFLDTEISVRGYCQDPAYDNGELETFAAKFSCEGKPGLIDNCFQGTEMQDVPKELRSVVTWLASASYHASLDGAQYLKQEGRGQ